MKWLYLILIIQVISCFLVTMIVFELGNHEDESSAYNRNSEFSVHQYCHFSCLFLDGVSGFEDKHCQRKI